MTRPRPDVGPNGPEIDAFLRAVDRLTDAQVLDLAGWAHPDPEADRALQEMRRAAAARAADGGRSAAIGWARDELADRLTRMAKSPFDSDLVFASGTVHALEAERREAFPVLLDTLVALILRDLLSADEFDLLSSPWLESRGELT